MACGPRAVFAGPVRGEIFEFRQNPDTWELTKGYIYSFCKKKGGSKKNIKGPITRAQGYSREAFHARDFFSVGLWVTLDTSVSQPQVLFPENS